MITSINVDGLYDELKLSEFNDKAMTVDGKPLALGNGKIISNPLFTSKNNLYTAGQCTWYVFDKRAQAGHTISTFWGDARNWAGQASGDGFKVDHKPEKVRFYRLVMAHMDMLLLLNALTLTAVSLFQK